jgi:Iap family predicted aminopeptidase
MPTRQTKWLSGRLVFTILILCSLTGDLFAESSPGYEEDRVLAHIASLSEAIGIREAGTPNEGRAAAYIASEFIKLGLDTRIQPFRVGNHYSQNVVASQPGLDERTGIIYIGAHYDSVQWGPGANDNASGTAVLLEVARLLSSEPISPTLTFIAFGAEERSLAGSGRYVSSMTGLEPILARAMFNMDCVGWGTQQGIGLTNQTSSELAERTAAHARDLGFTIDINRVYNSDHARFSGVGIPAIMLYSYDPTSSWVCGPHYHQSGDTADTLDTTQMANVAQILLAAVTDLADDPPTKMPTSLWLPLLNPASDYR